MQIEFENEKRKIKMRKYNLRIEKWKTQKYENTHKNCKTCKMQKQKNEKRNDDVDDDGEEIQHFLYIQTPDRPHQRPLLVL